MNIKETRPHGPEEEGARVHAMAGEHGGGGLVLGRPAWAAEYETVVVWEDDKSKKWRMPPSVKTLLLTPFRAQKMAPKAQKVLDFFNEAPAYTAPPTDEIKPTPSCAKTVLKLKDDPTSSFGPYSVGQLNVSKLLKAVLKCEHVAAESKATLCAGRTDKDAQEWLRGHKREREAVEEDGGAALDQMEREEKRQAGNSETKESERQAVLDARTVDRCSQAEAAVLNHYLAVFIFMCRLAFAVADNIFSANSSVHCGQRTNRL